jgi:hypothetical protein
MVIKFWNKVLKHAGFGEYTFTIANNNPVSMLGNLDISKFLSVNEIRNLLGYDPTENEASNNKTLYETLGSGAQGLLTIVTSKDITVNEKRAMLEVLFNLDVEQINKLVPLPAII